jgi:hypothetical protein
MRLIQNTTICFIFNTVINFLYNYHTLESHSATGAVRCIDIENIRYAIIICLFYLK